MTDYFNDNDPSACAWLRELIQQGHLPQGNVDERPIQEVKAADLVGYRQCHFFAGIGGWSYALQLAGWPATRPVWTGSCPCQPFSAAGKRKGEADERHLWPTWMALVRQCRPDCIFGEQVSSGDGYEWLDGVRLDLEAEGYAFGAADLPAASAGAPHVRQRLFWCAKRLPDADDARQRSGSRRVRESQKRNDSGRYGTPGDLPVAGDTCYAVCNGWKARHMRDAREGEKTQAGQSQDSELRGGRSCWDTYEVIHYRDGKTRRVEPGAFPLAHGVPLSLVEVWAASHAGQAPPKGKFPGRVGLLRGYGNAIVPDVAAAFIRAFLEAERDLNHADV